MKYVFDDALERESEGWLLVPYSDLEFAKLEIQLGGKVCLVFTWEEYEYMLHQDSFPLRVGSPDGLIIRVNMSQRAGCAATGHLFRHLEWAGPKGRGYERT